jgi:hypothetical protein
MTQTDARGQNAKMNLFLQKVNGSPRYDATAIETNMTKEHVMTYEELYRYHYANGDVALAQLYKELYEVQEQLDSLQKELEKKNEIIWQLENDE